MKDVIVKKSKIDGYGIFAAHDFKKGDIVIKWDTTHKLTLEDVKKLPGKEKNYVAYNEGSYILMQSPAKYVNHSCNPNTYSKNFCDIAKRGIKKGEEITGDYSEDLAPGVEMNCKCGSKNCRKVIKKR